MPEPQHVSSTRPIPHVARNHVYVVMLDGVDPVGASHLAGLRNYLNRLGYRKTIYGSVYRTTWVANQMHHYAKSVPNARFVVVGCGLGAKKMPQIVNDAYRGGIPIDLVVHFDHEMTSGAVETCSAEGYAKVIRLGSVKSQESVDRLVDELAAVSARIPIVYPPARQPIRPRQTEQPEKLHAPRTAPQLEQLPFPQSYNKNPERKKSDAKWNKALDAVSVLETPTGY